MTSRSKPTPTTPAPFLGRKVLIGQADSSGSINLRAPSGRIGDPDTDHGPTWTSPAITARPMRQAPEYCQAGIAGGRRSASLGNRLFVAGTGGRKSCAS